MRRGAFISVAIRIEELLRANGGFGETFADVQSSLASCIDSDVFDAIGEVRRVRNAAAHDTNEVVSYLQTAECRASFDDAVQKIEDYFRRHAHRISNNSARIFFERGD